MKLLEFLEYQGFAEGSFYAAAQRFLRRKKKEVASHSVEHLFNSLYALGKKLKNPPLEDVTYQILRDYADGLRLRYALGTIKPVIGDIKQFFKWAYVEGHIAHAPAERLRKPPDEAIAREARPKAAPETAVQAVIWHLTRKIEHLVYRDVFGVLSVEPPETWLYHDLVALRDLFAIVFLYETGGRAGELARLSTRAMKLACGEKKEVYTVVGVGKTNDVDLRFTHATAELWLVWQQVRPVSSEYAIFAWRGGELPQPRPMLTNTFSQAIARRCQQAGVSSVFRSHAVRHTKITRSEVLVGIEVTSRLIGHSSLRVTRSYVDAQEKRLIEAAAKTGLQYGLFQE